MGPRGHVYDLTRAYVRFPPIADTRGCRMVSQVVSRDPVIIVLVAVALVMGLWFAGVFGIAFVALMGTVVTIGLAQGSLAPVLPAFSRSTAPIKYWTLILICTAGVVANIANLLVRSSRQLSTHSRHQSSVSVLRNTAASEHFPVR